MTPEEFSAATAWALEDTAGQCHAASLALVRVLGGSARVARGSTPGVPGQHSWVVLGDPYDPEVEVIDPTLWCYIDAEPFVWRGRASERPHRPHGAGSIWEYGRPGDPEGPVIEISTEGLSKAARGFLAILGPLDYKGWAVLAHAPVGGWPSGEILAAMARDERLSALTPIDVLGMATDLDPSGLYLGGR